MHLMRRGQPASGQDRLCRRPAKVAHIGPVTRAAEAELVQAACAAEKTMRHACQQRRGVNLKGAHLSHPAIG
jgi:hypothetical protein